MLIIAHIVLAFSALVLSSFNFFRPLYNRLKTSYWLASGTLVSGVLLIVANKASVLRTCLTGILFFGVVSVLNESARHKLATENSDI